jgi:DNA-binding CsgD family transcriptional regulator
MADRHRLHGRTGECRALDDLIAAVRTGSSRVLVLPGEPGIGKSALLEYLTESATSFLVIRAAGVESDMELAFAGLQQLCVPLMSYLDRLPRPQRAAIETAFGISTGPAPDRFLVGLAVLGLLAAASEAQPVLCAVDDAQWLDRVSAQTLSFVARRLLAESVALVFAQREPVIELAGLPQLAVHGLAVADARALLQGAVLGGLDLRVRDQIVAETQGNPLALLELPRDMSAAELAGGYYRPDARPLVGQMEERFAARINKLPNETQRVLAVAAAEPVGDAMLLLRAAGLLGLAPDSVEPAAAAGLIEVDTRVRFRHPLVRSAAYRWATAGDRRAAHQALADASDVTVDPDRRAWHRAHAAAMPDESVAAELVASADRAQLRGGTAAAAAFLARAAELTPDPAVRGARAIAAAEAKAAAAAPEAAEELLAFAESAPLDDLMRGRAARLRAHLMFARGRGTGSAPLLRESVTRLADTARRLEPLDEQLAWETHLAAVTAAMYVGRAGGTSSVRDIAAALRARTPTPRGPVDLVVDALAIRHTEGSAAAQPAMRAAAAAMDTGTWLWQGFPLVHEALSHELWDDGTRHRWADEAVRLATEAGALAVLPTALVSRAGVHVLQGEFTAAEALFDKADEISSSTGNAPLRYHKLILAAWSGVEAAATLVIDSAVRDAESRGEGRVIGLADYSKALLYNGLGSYQLALGAVRRLFDYDDIGLRGWSLVELIEAATRVGEHDLATRALAQLEERTRAAGTDWALATLARSQAMLATGNAAEELYVESLERFGRTRVAVMLARSHLLYGEWLRRENRRGDARDHLRAAHEMFTRFGASAFADRARRELLATGEKTAKRSVGAGDALTPQEDQIAGLAAAGLTNTEIGAQLFLSAHTVEWHLRKVFVKLGIRSRRELRGTPWR